MWSGASATKGVKNRLHESVTKMWCGITSWECRRYCRGRYPNRIKICGVCLYTQKDNYGMWRGWLDWVKDAMKTNGGSIRKESGWNELSKCASNSWKRTASRSRSSELSDTSDTLCLNKSEINEKASFAWDASSLPSSWARGARFVDILNDMYVQEMLVRKRNQRGETHRIWHYIILS